jgi:hypothetical protein
LCRIDGEVLGMGGVEWIAVEDTIPNNRIGRTGVHGLTSFVEFTDRRSSDTCSEA